MSKDTKYFEHYLPDTKMTNDLFRNHILCHSSLLPSQIRYNLILEPPITEESSTPYSIGINQRNYGDPSINNYTNDPEALTLVYDPEERNREECDYPTRIDFKDRFFIGREQGNVSFTLPTEKELLVYQHNLPTGGSKVMVIVSHYRCDWGNCPGDYVTVEEMVPSQWGRTLEEDDGEYDDDEEDDDD